MTNFNQIQQKIQSSKEITDTLAQWRTAGQRIVFTNGCFDLLHYGHLHYLAQAREYLKGNVAAGAWSDVTRSRNSLDPVQGIELKALFGPTWWLAATPAAELLRAALVTELTDVRRGQWALGR
jgi:hypothetical protein